MSTRNNDIKVQYLYDKMPKNRNTNFVVDGGDEISVISGLFSHQYWNCPLENMLKSNNWQATHWNAISSSCVKSEAWINLMEVNTSLG